jgi:hypothetical protein
MVESWPFWARCAFVFLCGIGVLVACVVAEFLLLALDQWYIEHQRRKEHKCGK